MLTARPIALDTYRESVVVLSRRCLSVRPDRLAGSRKVEVRAGGRRVYAGLIITDDDSLVAPSQAGLSQPLFRRLGVPEGAPVEVTPARRPDSLDAVRRKVRGEVLSAADFAAVIGDAVSHAYSDMELAAFLVACAGSMTPDETLELTRAMVGSGRSLDWPRPVVVDKHCIGGIPGNRTSLIVAPIVAAHGLMIPKTSSRAITSPAGTADTMEVLARVTLDEDEMRDVVERCHGCIVWGGRVDLSPADDVLISVERPLEVDMPEQMVASILSKKKAAGSTQLVLDVPVGRSSKVETAEQAAGLSRLFAYISGRLGLTLEITLTDGTRPVGRGVGPWLEARDVLSVLRGEAEAPQDLRTKALMLAGKVLDFDPEVRGRGAAVARDLLESGAALRQMETIIEAQGPPPARVELGPLCAEIVARTDGTVARVDCRQISAVARLAGAPTDPGAGLDLLKTVGDTVRKGDPLYRIHGVDPTDFAYARDAAQALSGYEVR